MPPVKSEVVDSQHLGWYSRGYLPHLDQPGLIQSLNFRLADSLPATLVNEWRAEIDSNSGPTAVSRGSPEIPSVRKDAELRRRIEEYLDAGFGACWLHRREIARLVENALCHFDGVRYQLLAWCVMPNHVHVLIETKSGFPLADIVQSWKSFTSKQANKILHRQGVFWQREYLDRFVRDARHYANIVNYIEDNPVKARLVQAKPDWLWSSARYRMPTRSRNLGAPSVPVMPSVKLAGETPALPG